MPRTIFCGQCGEQFSQEYNFCPRCGTPADLNATVLTNRKPPITDETLTLGGYRKETDMLNLPKQSGFSQDELLNGKWAKISEYGQTFLLTFSADGTFREQRLFKEQDPGIQARWELTDAMLRLTTEWEGKRYVLLVSASSTGIMYSGIENGHVHYKLIHLPDVLFR